MSRSRPNCQLFGSMEPTLLIGSYLFVSKFSYGYSCHLLSVFGAIVFRPRPGRPADTRRRSVRLGPDDFIKRDDYKVPLLSPEFAPFMAFMIELTTPVLLVLQARRSAGHAVDQVRVRHQPGGPPRRRASKSRRGKYTRFVEARHEFELD